MTLRLSVVAFTLVACDPGKDDGTSAGDSGAPTECFDENGEPTSPIAVFPDADGDGYGDDAGQTTACALADGFLLTGGDCDDSDPEINPDATEVCDDADTDEDCNGLADNDDPGADPSGMVSGWADSDEDGHGDAANPGVACDLYGNFSDSSDDCDDNDATVYPGAPEYCDDKDNDCDGETDEDAIDADTWYADADRDGYGDPYNTLSSCLPVSGYVDDATDCDDTDSAVNPEAEESCNGVDDDCDGDIDEDDAVDAADWFLDADGDGWGDPDASTFGCDPGAGWVRDGNDCDDGDPAVNPGEDEVCDEDDVDEDCNGLADDDDAGVDGSGKTRWFTDADGDGYGEYDTPVVACDAPAGTVDNSDDCDDTDASINPGAVEVCDATGIDEDCDGLINDDDPSVTGTSTGWLDSDGDGFGDPATSMTACELSYSYVLNDDDCEDADATINPSATEVCDEDDTDENCNGLADDDDPTVDSAGMSTWYADSDGDGYGTGSSTTTACDAPAGYAATSDDCDDTDAAINPGASEVCGDSVDDNCDGITACDTDVDDADRAFTGTTASLYMSWSVRSAGDQNNDGVDDFVLGTYSNSGSTSTVDATYVINGGGSGDITMSSANATIQATGYGGGGCGGCGGGGPCGGGGGPCGGGGGGCGGCGGGGTGTGSGYVGSSVAGIGDSNGDGYDDFVIGGTGYSGGSSNSGVVYLFRGPQSGTVNVSSATTTWSGSSSEEAGVVQPAGDVNNDGTSDFLIGADAYSSSTGRAYLITSYSTGSLTTSSVATATFTGESSGDYLTATGGAGDLDGDGYDDVILGAYGDDDIGTDSGAAYVCLGPQSSSITVSSCDLKVKGEAAGDYAGQYTSIGDLDGDGHDDLVISAPHASPYGYAYVLAGPFSSSWSLSSATATVQSARARGPLALDARGDVDDDGNDDLLLGYPADNTTGGYGGAAALVHGPLSGAIAEDDAEWLITGTGASEYVGYAVSYLGTQDGSVGEDVLVAAPYDSSGTGAAYLFYGDGI